LRKLRTDFVFMYIIKGICGNKIRFAPVHLKLHVPHTQTSCNV